MLVYNLRQRLVQSTHKKDDNCTWETQKTSLDWLQSQLQWVKALQTRQDKPVLSKTETTRQTEQTHCRTAVFVLRAGHLLFLLNVTLKPFRNFSQLSLNAISDTATITTILSPPYGGSAWSFSSEKWGHFQKKRAE